MSHSREMTISELLADQWIQEVYWHDVIDSTNLFAKSLFSPAGTPPLPILVLADQQTEGRGRGSNEWWSPSGCLMLTLVWRPTREIPADSTSQMALIVGLCVADTIDHFSTQLAKVKWPNDVYLDSRKVAGILIESLSSGLWAIGIGVNVRVPMHTADSLLQDKATSLHYWCGREVNKEEFLLELCHRLRMGLTTWEQNPKIDPASWDQRCWLTGRVVQVVQSSQQVTGLCEGVDEKGQLVVRSEDGRRRLILSGTVTVAAY